MKIIKCFGIDLGTTNTTASLIEGGEFYYSKETKSSTTNIPSFFSIRHNKAEVLGTLAKNEFYLGNPNSKKSVKRDMGKDIKYKYLNKEYDPVYISSKIINFAKEKLFENVKLPKNVEYNKAIITVPAYFTLAARDATRKAAELAGLEVEMLLEEPTAAALNYSIKNNVDSALYLVLDLGGGTFDISVVEKTGNIPSVLATGGNNFLGGDNFDFILAHHFLEHLKKTSQQIPDIKADMEDSLFRQLVLAAENIKKQLSIEKEYNIYFPDVFKNNSGIELIYDNFSREEFENLIKEKISIDMLNEIDKTLKTLELEHEKTLKDITDILLVGASTKIPLIKEIINQKYNKNIIQFEVESSVATGAALAANSSGFTVLNKDLELSINAPYSLDADVFITGELNKGDLSKIEFVIAGKKYETKILDDKTFIFTIANHLFEENYHINLYNNSDLVGTTDISSTKSDIITPTAIQNEEITIEILNEITGEVERYPIVIKGDILPSETIENFKINKYSEAEILLPVWEGNRKIFNLRIKTNYSLKAGSNIEVKTIVDSLSNISLEVSSANEKLEGEYEYLNLDNVNEKEEELLDKQFSEKISKADSSHQAKIITEKENIERELKEAKNNNDSNHYDNVLSKYEKLIDNIELETKLTEKNFDEIGLYIIENKKEETLIEVEDVENLVFHGKRFLERGNLVEAENSYLDLQSLKTKVDLYNSPKKYMQEAIALSIGFIINFEKLKKDKTIDQVAFQNIANKFSVIDKKATDIINKYKGEIPDTEETFEDAQTLINLIAPLYQELYTLMPSLNAESSQLSGLLSKGG